MAKIYYSEQEAAAKLRITPADLANYVRDGKLRSYQDGPRRMYKVEEVDMLASDSVGEIELAPADTASGVSLTDADKPMTGKAKEDTVITAEGISIFDSEDLEIEAADPMAKTQIAPSLEDQVTVEGVGSGSGLLDLTRESDDTSLGAEVLDHIDMEGGIGSSIGGEAIAAPAGMGAPAAYGMAPEMAPAVNYVEASDPMSGLFGGMLVAAALLVLNLMAAVLSMIFGVLPDAVAGMKENMIVVLLVSVVVIGAGAAIGYFVGKSGQTRQLAMQRAGQ